MDSDEDSDVEIIRQEFMQMKRLTFKSKRLLQRAIECCDVELLKSVLKLYEAWIDETPLYFPDYFAINPLCCISRVFHDEADKLEIVKLLMPYLTDCYSFQEFFPALLTHCVDGNFLVTEFLIHKFYSENNSLYPLIKKLQTAVEKSHYICILLHDDIDSVMKLLSFEEFDKLGLFDLEYFGTFFQIFLKLLNTHENIGIAVETFQVLLEKNFCEFVKDEDIMKRTLNYFFCDEEEEEEDDEFDRKIRIYENSPLAMFQFVYNSIHFKTQEKIYDIISEWFRVCFAKDIEDFKIIFKQTMVFLRPFISRPLNKKLKIKVKIRRNRALTSNVPSLQELSRRVIRCKIFEQTSDVKEFMKRIWTLQLPLTVKCFLLYVPDPAWMNNLQMS